MLLCRLCRRLSHTGINLSTSMLISYKNSDRNPGLAGIQQGKRSGMFYTSFHTSATQKHGTRNKLHNLTILLRGVLGMHFAACACVKLPWTDPSGCLTSHALVYYLSFVLFCFFYTKTIRLWTLTLSSLHEKFYGQIQVELIWFMAFPKY